MLQCAMSALLLTAGFAIYLGVIALLRVRRAHRVMQLQPKPGGDPHVLAWYLAFVEFPLMFDIGTHVGFFSTFAVPSIAAVLNATRGFELACQLRYDDSVLLMREVSESGCRSARGAAALKRVNEIHGRVSGIKREDMLYTLWVFCFEPVRWIDAYGWRQLEPFEKEALFAFWREVGVGLNIADIPKTCAEFETWGQAYEKARFRRTRASVALTEHVIRLAASWGPSWLPSSSTARAWKRQLIVWILCALSPSQDMVDAIGLAEERARMPWILRALLRSAAVARGCLVRWLLPPRPEWCPATHLGEAQDHENTQHETIALQAVRYPCPYATMSYRKQGSYRLQDLGHPIK